MIEQILLFGYPQISEQMSDKEKNIRLPYPTVSAPVVTICGKIPVNQICFDGRLHRRRAQTDQRARYIIDIIVYAARPYRYPRY